MTLTVESGAPGRRRRSVLAGRPRLRMARPSVSWVDAGVTVAGWARMLVAFEALRQLGRVASEPAHEARPLAVPGA